MDISYLSRNRKRMALELAITDKLRFFSSVFYLQHQAVTHLMKRYLQGLVIDLGCGNVPFMAHMPTAVVQVHTLDVTSREGGPELTYVSDIQNMLGVPTAYYDGALCLEVLEHVPKPLAALREVYRILKPGGNLILTVPHLSRLHDEPHDYYRFTVHGLRYLLESAGFEVLELQCKGGLLSFLGHQLSTLLLTLTWGIPVVGTVIWHLNKWLVTLPASYLDSLIDAHGTFASGYSVAARKPLVAGG